MTARVSPADDEAAGYRAARREGLANLAGLFRDTTSHLTRDELRTVLDVIGERHGLRVGPVRRAPIPHGPPVLRVVRGGQYARGARVRP